MKVKSFFLVVIIMFISDFAVAQNDMSYKDGNHELYILVAKNLKFPPVERKKGIEGQVLIKFRIREDHNIDSISILNSVSKAIDKEALRVLQLTNGSWNVKESQFFLMPIKFVLSFPGRVGDDEIKKRIKEHLEQKDYKHAIKDLNEIRRRDPFDLDNLNNLIFAYNQIGETTNELEIKNLKEEIEFFRSGQKVVK